MTGYISATCQEPALLYDPDKFSSVDLLRWQKKEERNRRRLRRAECAWARRREDAWLTARHQVVVMGDINDGPEMDWFEMRFGKSAVDLLMGDLFDPDRILRNLAGRPDWTRNVWRP